MSEALPENALLLCESDAVQEGGKGVRFDVMAGREKTTGFVVRYKGVVRAYLNRCAHVPMELDWNVGEFFESSGLYLMCSTHGALYAPDTGRCEGGPCRGKRLRPIAVFEDNEQVFWQPDEFISVIPDSSTQQE